MTKTGWWREKLHIVRIKLIASNVAEKHQANQLELFDLFQYVTANTVWWGWDFKHMWE
jgi:hypothetical protein